ncbi:MAG: bifunctional UDP-N-acetylglucosamine diphosphorylase/glucosamine-1-phosphate N-acetyltransferase GlmU [Micavibrio aeruginosavorus]|uniref:Bifunctional protein GlmU n=1 Tax=Micavibrio aeruginosavorus TaxID=349221 RepID=A0A2W5N9B7_9BACT|nr:MAG: bifunctional UDP-N-acetylglucosamine diphosphorylase/glucosamine-1-phosphate N-acetyltransferase GlmU [Micavibrio aeruginosavorus]
MTRKTPLAIVILAAGKGTRMKSDKPKVMHEIAGRPMIGWLLETAQALNPEKIIVVTAPGMDDVAAAAAPHQIAVQKEQRGTGDAVKPAVPFLKGFEGKVLILLGDEPFLDKAVLEEMIGWNGLSVMAVRPLSPKGLGRMIANEDGTLDRIVEEKDATEEQKEIRLCNAGNFCVPSSHLSKWLDQLQANNAQKEFYLTDIPRIAEKDGYLTYVVETDVQWIWGINTRAELAEHERMAQTMLREKAMIGGATLMDPNTVYFSYDTQIGKDVVVEPNVYFGPHVTIADNVTIHAFSHLEGVTIEEKASVGPFARIRGGTKLGAGVKVGNFVEIKKSDIAAGAKMSHLTYIGDSVIGAKTNIGAGTITCNYDGYNKHQTVIGEGVFVGSNSTLVAPVKLGDGSFVAAGSVVTHNVPKDALIVARSHQMVKEGWAKNYRNKKKDKKGAA